MYYVTLNSTHSREKNLTSEVHKKSRHEKLMSSAPQELARKGKEARDAALASGALLMHPYKFPCFQPKKLRVWRRVLWFQGVQWRRKWLRNVGNSSGGCLRVSARLLGTVDTWPNAIAKRTSGRAILMMVQGPWWIFLPWANKAEIWKYRTLYGVQSC